MSYDIALIGCGAIAREFYLPALVNRRHELANIWLIDTDESARHAAVSVCTANIARALSDVKADPHFVIIATPNQSHFSLAGAALERGAHVLIEKPFVIWPDDGRRLVEIAAERQRIIAINQTRRFFRHASDLRRRIRSGEFGHVRSIVHNEGAKMTWPYQSGAAFAKGAERTGVIMDTGVHVIDFYQYLLEPEWTLVSAIDDGFSGPEGLAQVELLADGAPVSLRLSRYQQQENVARLSCERAEISIDIYDTNAYSIRTPSGAIDRVVARPPDGHAVPVAEALLANLFAAAEGREAAVCDAASSLPVIELLDKIYRSARRYSAILGAV